MKKLWVDRDVRATFGASLSPDATAFAHLVDDGGYPRAVQRFLRGRRASSSRDVELPAEGPVTKVVPSATATGWPASWHPRAAPVPRSGWSPPTPTTGWLAASPAWMAGTAELISWDGDRVCAILTGEDGVGQSTLFDPADGAVTALDRRSGGRLVGAWAGAALIRAGPRGYRELTMLRGSTEIALLPSDPGSSTEAGVILDDHTPRRLRCGLDGECTAPRPVRYLLFGDDGQPRGAGGHGRGLGEGGVRSDV